ncbi:MAG TPA: aminotransferase class I/II-fold pyridoxal phosphate-dependent enzyme [Salinivirga sp.]|uniref:pyridoxal phosphate-dependent aminotransferase n=1 Tax=Salinivirga sp. TaxID=1970192 RepID=UPI002B47DDA9|nr:aminotransferase class I/II-fold pyridoxal phosphate-dependent enzyme [Salinivirga sp.]HKK59279.1 aminotransferase class I/II-fold pyridoxal phosphate-dependent enzyme [Salinivirga sp.]
MNIEPAERIKRVETYYFSGKLEEIRQLQSQGHSIINLGIGNPDMAVHEQVLNTLRKSSEQPQSHYYQPYKGTAMLRNAFSDWYQRIYNIKLNSENEILPLAGSKEGIMLAMLAFVNAGDSVLVPNPGYPAYTAVAKLLGANVIHYNLKAGNGWHPDFSELEQLAREKPKIMWVNYPHMPTGAKASNELFKKLIKFGKQHKVLIAHDNPYSLILNDKPLSILSVAGSKETCFELNSLSKSHRMQGFRVGMIAGHQQLIKHLLKVKSNYDSGMYLPIQTAASEALHLDKHWHKTTNQVYSRRRKLVFEALDHLNCSYSNNTSGMFVWAKVPDAFSDGYAFVDHLLYNHGVFVAPGGIFGSNGNQYVRFSLAAPNEGFELMLNRIKNQQKIAI